MKSFSLFFTAFFLFFSFGCGSSMDREETVAVEYASETISLETMKCQMCAGIVQKAAGGVAGVKTMNVNFDAKIGTVSFDPGKTSIKEIELAIANAGYHANETKRNEDTYLNLPDCCR